MGSADRFMEYSWFIKCLITKTQNKTLLIC
jgi:hypothetical protein